jgi:N-acetylglucosaminyldiphosphoundecaprenol N-acetyl-beta-D-mannosaminyltransferase
MQLFGIEIDGLAMSEAVARVLALARRPLGGSNACPYVVTPNINHVVLLSESAELRTAYGEASLVLADSTPLVWLSRLRRRPLPCRVAGSDLAAAVLAAATQDAPLTVFLLGAAVGVAERAKLNVEREHASVRVVGVHSPPFGFERDALENEKVLALVAAARPEVLLIGLGAPKQELWVHRHRHRLHAGVALCVGGTIDFMAGAKARAPRWMQRSGCEWLFRAAQEPTRLGPRYFRDALAFLRLLWAEVRAERHAATTGATTATSPRTRDSESADRSR